MKSRQFKKVVSSAISLLLIVMIIFSVSVPNVFAQEKIFSGIEPLEVQENETVDLLQGVVAVSPAGENLQVSVKNVMCTTDGAYQYDDSGILNAGAAGSVYHIEYEAVSSVDVEEIYSITREIRVISEEPTFEEEQGTFTEEMPLEEESGTLPEETLEENSDDSLQELTDEISEEFSDGSVEEVVDSPMGVGTQIIFENGIHYINDPEYPDHKITLFCMNNKLHWPHHTEQMGDVQVPGYTEGYLTPEDFQSEEAYQECMRRLSKLLYAGYPYNGERLYKIVENSEKYAPTEEEFNDMLIVPAVLQTAYPYLGHHNFSYDDYKSNNTEHLDLIKKFTQDVVKLSIDQGTTSNGLTFEDISSMPFYKAAFSITNTNNQTPLESFQFFYGASYFVTEEEAYKETQNAVWHLLYEYGIKDNEFISLSSKLATVLYTYSERGGLLDYKPSVDNISIEGDLRFIYNPKDGMWHSSPLKIIEPDEYRGVYKLELPQGVTAQCDNLNYVYGNEEYELVSDHKPEYGEYFGIRAEFVWLKEFKQYSPTPDIEVEGKKFQHMIGAVIENETLYITKEMSSRNVGNLSITKKVKGEENCQTEFQFELKLPQYKNLSGLYGDLEFTNGVSQFTLKDGETKTATNLPADTPYVVRESETEGYEIGSTHAEGNVPISDTQFVTFTNIKLPDLTLGKIVTGEMGDKSQKFNFIIELKDKDGNPVNAEFAYSGSVYPGHEHETTAPENGILEFIDGKTRIQLSHGQQITIKDLPYQGRYTVTETAQDGYDTTYNKGEKPENALLDEDKSICIENHKGTPPLLQTGNLSVSKTVTGSDGDINKKFTFTVELSDKKINGTYGDMTFKDGIASFTLKHGEKKTAVGLSAGIGYIVTESDNEGYKVTSTGNVGTIKADEISKVQFENYKDNSSGEHHDDTQITVKKIWKLDNGGKPTNSITAVLMRNGQQYEKVELNAENNWEYTWHHLSAQNEWTVIEINVPEGFTVTTEQKGTEIIITNDDIPTPSSNPNKPTNPTDPNKPSNPDNSSQPTEPSNPVKTGDTTNIMIYVFVAVGALVLIGVLLYIRKHNNKKKQ